jgi:hypothetical protein
MCAAVSNAANQRGEPLRAWLILFLAKIFRRPAGNSDYPEPSQYLVTSAGRASGRA